jgi:asparagine synthase (glutamine-hydrolysing)
MCGIAGLIAKTPPAEASQAVERMVGHLQHRGPDGSGVSIHVDRSGRAVGLGHTRLAIIDLSDAGRQPMHLADGSLSISFNGEIYNYQELRRQLQCDWTTHSDTEVLLRAYATWGRDCVRHLRGMFAFAIWDGERQELFLARDRLGIKPVYYYSDEDEQVFVFASEVRALLASGMIPRRLDEQAIHNYLAYQSVPAPATMIQGVRALPPGAWLVVDRHGHVIERRYWDLLADASPEASQASAEAARRRVADLLREAVELHLVSDVPVGAFLSGGIDSSAIVSLMREAGQVPLTFSVVFAERAFDEAQYARRVAAHYDTQHTEIRLSADDLLAQLPDALGALDQPSGDGVNTFVVARAVRGAGLKVALSGLGGDELFGGYPSFGRLSRTSQLFREWGRAPRPVRALAARTVEVLGRSSVGAGKVAAMLSSSGQLAQLYPVTRQVLSPRQRHALLGTNGVPDPYVELLESAYRGQPGAGVMAAISYAEGRTYMHDVLLRDTDQMSMNHALEVRVPFLDHRLVEYVMGLPDSTKQPRGTPKRLLVDSLTHGLPPDVVYRRKQGFTLPFDEWMRGGLRQLCSDRLDGLAERGLFRPEAIQDLWSGFLSYRRDATWTRVWILVVLQDWLQRNEF